MRIGVSNKLVKHLVHNEIEKMWCLLKKIVEKGRGLNTQMLYANTGHFEG